MMSAQAVPHEADDDDDEALLYGDIGSGAAPLLPSEVELRATLATTVAQRESLEAHLRSLQSEELQAREAIKDLTRRACVLLTTARHELKRKDEQLSGLQPPRTLHRVPSSAAPQSAPRHASESAAHPPPPREPSTSHPQPPYPPHQQHGLPREQAQASRSPHPPW